jgi:hypothetical protein
MAERKKARALAVNAEACEGPGVACEGRGDAEDVLIRTGRTAVIGEAFAPRRANSVMSHPDTRKSPALKSGFHRS